MVQQPNMQLKRIWVPELNKNVRVRLTTRALRTVTKMGLLPFLKKNNIKLKDITRG
jgi:large subunit ribosomal protein L28